MRLTYLAVLPFVAVLLFAVVRALIAKSRRRCSIFDCWEAHMNAEAARRNAGKY